MWKVAAYAPLLVVAALLSAPASAAEPVVGIRSLAMGDSLRGAARGDTGVLLNPSGIALFREYVVTGSYGLHMMPYDQMALGHGLHVSITDSVTQRKVAMGLYYNFIYDSPRAAFRVLQGTPETLVPVPSQAFTRSGHEVGAVTAFPLGDRFILGTTVKYAYFSTTAQLADPFVTSSTVGKDLSYDLGTIGSVVTLDIGLSLRLTDGLSVGLVGQNLWGHGSELPTQLGLGLAYAASARMTLAADLLVNFTGYQECASMLKASCPTYQNRIVFRAGGGAEYSIADRVPLRLGYLFDSNLTSHHLTGGLGYFDARGRWGVDAGFRQRLAGGAETLLLFGVRILRD